jgi:acyl-homoserine-lactone acylase
MHGPLRLVFFLSLLPLAGATFAAAPDPAAMARSVTIYRDTFGVPHIYGPSDASVVFGLAYAQAEDNFPLVEDGFIRALGRAAEAHGEGALRDDQLARAL